MDAYKVKKEAQEAKAEKDVAMKAEVTMMWLGTVGSL